MYFKSVPTYSLDTLRKHFDALEAHTKETRALLDAMEGAPPAGFWPKRDGHRRTLQQNVNVAVENLLKAVRP